MSLHGRMAAAAWLLTACAAACADWTETNNDGGPGGLDYLDDWVAVWQDADEENPDTEWFEAADLAATYGTDSGWQDNVVLLSDEDAVAYVAANKVESFTDVTVTCGLSTVDTDEEFGVVARCGDIDFDDPITEVTCYAATFNANDAGAVGEPMAFALYKIEGGAITASVASAPLVPAGYDDYILCVELTVVGGTVTAKLFEDCDSPSPLSTLEWVDASPLGGGYSGAIDLDTASADGIGSYYDTLSSVIVPEPSAALLLAAAAVGPLRRRRRR